MYDNPDYVVTAEDLNWEILHPNCRYLVWQEEVCPDTGRIHWQGYVEFFRSQRMAAVKKIFGDTVHVEPRRGTAQEADDYCSKDDTRLPGATVTRLGVRSAGAGARTDLKAADAIYAEAMELDAEGAIAFVRQNAPRDFALYGAAIQRNFLSLQPRHKPYEPIFDPMIGPALPVPLGLQQWLTTEFPKRSRAKCLFMIGPTKLGKTHWARSIVQPHMYFKGMTNYKEHWNPEAKLIIFDDFEWDYLQQPKAVLTQAGEATLTDKYCKKLTVNVNMPAIYITNDPPHKHGSNIIQDPYWQENGHFVDVFTKLY